MRSERAISTAASAAGAALARRRRQVETNCKYCNQVITGRTSKRYCGNACMQAAAYTRRAREADARDGGDRFAQLQRRRAEQVARLAARQADVKRKQRNAARRALRARAKVR